MKTKLSKLSFSVETTMLIEMFIIFLCIMVVMVGLWAIDIGASAMILNSGMDLNGGAEIIVGNGWHFREPFQQYHMGIYLTLAGMLLLAALSAYKTIKPNR